MRGGGTKKKKNSKKGGESSLMGTSGAETREIQHKVLQHYSYTVVHTYRRHKLQKKKKKNVILINRILCV